MAGSIERLLVATRKGLFTVERAPAGFEVSDVAFEGAEASMVTCDARNGDVYAALRRGAERVLARSRDGGRTYALVAMPEFPPGLEGEVSVELVTALVACGEDAPGELWAGTMPAGLFRSVDGGGSWEFAQALWARPERRAFRASGWGAPAVHSLLVEPRDSQQLLLGVSRGGVFWTGDAGASFQRYGAGLLAEEGAELPNPHRLARCRSSPEVVWCQHKRGLFRSTDGGATFLPTSGAADVFGFALAAHPYDPGTAWFVPGHPPNWEGPFERSLAVCKTRDAGETVQRKIQGLPQRFAYDVVYRHALEVDDSGTLLAMGSSTGNLWVSDDGGESFQVVSHHLPPVNALCFARARLRSSVIPL